MDDHKVKAIIFDLGNVLVDFDHRIAAGRIANFCDRNSEEIFSLFFDSELTGLFEEGKLSPQDFFSEVKKILNLRLDYAAFTPIWNEIFFLSRKNRGVYNLALGLKENYQVALLSNINILHFDYLKKNFPVFDAFHHIITSYEVGLRKPHPAIYQQALQTLNLAAGEVFYTDDRDDLIEKAGDLGIKSFHFESVDKLKADLSRAGIQ
ncbi:MAG: HAD family phosphatase [Candidatus Omnitrophica bacterium]|nr:HAD family phosphatase [Candidatus Omnitrophota bacterium]